MKSLIQTLNGDLLTKKYPDIKFQLDRGTDLIYVSKRKADGALVVVTISIHPYLLEGLPIDILEDQIHEAVMKLRTACFEPQIDNPSSRWFC